MNYKAFFAAYNASVQRGNPQSYKETVLEFTHGRTDSLSALAVAEVQELTRRLNMLTGFKPRTPSADPRIKMQRKIIAMAHEIGWRLPPPPSERGGEGRRKIDMKKLNDWCNKNGYLRKDFNKYTYKELPQLVAQFEKVYHFYLEKLNQKV